MAEKAAKALERASNGQFLKGQSGNAAGRPKGSRNAITLLKQSLELEMREQAAPAMEKVLDTAIALALDGDRTMIKLLLDLHMSKGASEESKAAEKVSIHIGTAENERPIIDVTPITEEDS